MTLENQTEKQGSQIKKNHFNNPKYGSLDLHLLNKNLINQRVVSEEHFATICYVGVLPNSNGMWLGVDWDDENRGRHNGTHNGVKYFNTHSPKSGSFVRPAKVSLGLTIEEAIERRYGCTDDPDLNYVSEEFFLESSDSDDECGTTVSLRAGLSLGHQKVKVHISGPANGSFSVNNCIDRLRSAVLHSLPVHRSMTNKEGGGHLGETFPLLDNLDLAQTLFSDWWEVAQTCKQLPNLKTLNISDNKLLPLFPSLDLNRGHITEERITLYNDAFKTVTYFVMVRVYYPWEEFVKVFDHMPALEHLCLAYNKLTCLHPCLHHNLSNLSYLDLACNAIFDFSENVLPFGVLVNLQTLLLNDNLLDSIIFPGQCPEDTDLFPKLKLLAISNNRISSWDTLHHISRLRSLVELIFMFNPILDQQKNQETSRQDVIAKLPRIKILNRNEIKCDERKGAEIDYMKRYGKKWLEAQSSAEDTEDARAQKVAVMAEFTKEHPRFMGLVDLYGAPEQSEMKEVSRKLKERLIEVTIEYLVNGEGDVRSLRKKIPSHMTVQHLRVLLRKLCKIPAKCEFSLGYVSQARPSIEIPLEADTREIGFYNVQTEDRVVVRLDTAK